MAGFKEKDFRLTLKNQVLKYLGFWAKVMYSDVGIKRKLKAQFFNYLCPGLLGHCMTLAKEMTKFCVVKAIGDSQSVAVKSVDVWTKHGVLRLIFFVLGTNKSWDPGELKGLNLISYKFVLVLVLIGTITSQKLGLVLWYLGGLLYGIHEPFFSTKFNSNIG